MAETSSSGKVDSRARLGNIVDSVREGKLHQTNLDGVEMNELDDRTIALLDKFILIISDLELISGDDLDLLSIRLNELLEDVKSANKESQNKSQKNLIDWLVNKITPLEAFANPSGRTGENSVFTNEECIENVKTGIEMTKKLLRI